MKILSDGLFFYSPKYGDNEVTIQDSVLSNKVDISGRLKKVFIGYSHFKEDISIGTKKTTEVLFEDTTFNAGLMFSADNNKFVKLNRVKGHYVDFEQYGTENLQINNCTMYEIRMMLTNSKSIVLSNNLCYDFLSIDVSQSTKNIINNLKGEIKEFIYSGKGVEFSEITNIKSSQITITGEKSGRLLLNNIYCNELHLEELSFLKYDFRHIYANKVFVNQKTSDSPLLLSLKKSYSGEIINKYHL